MIGLCGLHERPEQRCCLHGSWDSQEGGILSLSLGQEWQAQAQAQAPAMNLELPGRWLREEVMAGDVAGNILATGFHLVIIDTGS